MCAWLAPRLMRVLDPKARAFGTLELAAVADLSAGFSVEGRAVEHYLGLRRRR